MNIRTIFYQNYFCPFRTVTKILSHRNCNCMSRTNSSSSSSHSCLYRQQSSFNYVSLNLKSSTEKIYQGRILHQMLNNCTLILKMIVLYLVEKLNSRVFSYPRVKAILGKIYQNLANLD